MKIRTLTNSTSFCWPAPLATLYNQTSHPMCWLLFIGPCHHKPVCLWHYNAFWCLLRWASGLHLTPWVVVATNRFLLFIDKHYSILWMNCHSLLKQLPWRTFGLLPVLNNYGWLINRNIHMYVLECYIFIRMLSNCFFRLGTSLHSFYQ